MIQFFLKLFILIRNFLPHTKREGGIRRGNVTRVCETHTTVKIAILYTKEKKTTIILKESNPPQAIRSRHIPRSRLRISILNVGRNHLQCEPAQVGEDSGLAKLQIQPK